MTDIEKNFWCDFCKLHKELKRIYILSEEHSKDFSCILQPIKEQRDALEHVVRAYCKIIDKSASDNVSYIEKNLSKAKGHLYRAYYDTADIFTIILREKISDYLSLFSYNQIISVWDKDVYDKERKYLIRVNKEIAELRIKKDVIEKEDEREEIFSQYHAIISHLFELYELVLLDIYPSLAEKFN
ncbi:MAG: hypothetical protein IJD09_00520 [Clostridia bacterium]|nr:hypothetical protein [Clostridia bacterium]